MAVAQNRVIFSLLDTPAFGGAEQYMFSHLSFLSKHGYEVVLATNNEVVRKEILSRLNAEEQKKFQVITAPYRLDAIGNWKGLVKYFLAAPYAIFWCGWILFSLQKKYDETICFFAGWSDRVTFSPIVNFFGSPLVWIEFGPLEPVFERNWGFPKVLFFLTKNLPNHFVTISQWTMNSMINTGRISRDKIALIYPGIKSWTAKELTAYKKAGQVEFKKRKLNDSKVIGYIGRLASENQIDLLLRAFALLKEKKVKLLIIGAGPEKLLYQNLTKQLGIEKDVHFAGFVDEQLKLSLLSCCDLFVFPGAWKWEGFGITTIEVLSLGVPVITPDFGPQKEIIVNGISGLHFVPNDQKSLKEKMGILLADATLRKKLAVAGQKRAQYFDEKKYLLKMKKVVDTVAKT